MKNVSILVCTISLVVLIERIFIANLIWVTLCPKHTLLNKTIHDPISFFTVITLSFIIVYTYYKKRERKAIDI